jgi:hypothetical protein
VKNGTMDDSVVGTCFGKEQEILIQITGIARLKLVECKGDTSNNESDSSSTEGSYANDSA